MRRLIQVITCLIMLGSGVVYADNLSLNIGNGITLSIPCSNLQAAYFLDMANWRNLAGAETTIVDYKGIVSFNIGAITNAPNIGMAECSLNYIYKTNNLLISQLQLGIFVSNDATLQNGRFINTYGLKAVLPIFH